MSLEGVAKDIKNEKQPMGKRDNGWRTIWGVEEPQVGLGGVDHR